MTVEAGSPEERRETILQARAIGRRAEPYAAEHDRAATFVHEGYEAFRETGFSKAAVPVELGGSGARLDAICRAQALLAGFCANTALAIAMHQHNVLTMAWRWRRGDRLVEPVLRRIVDQGLLLASSGTMDLTRISIAGVATEGGLRVTGQKRYCSASPGADALSTLVAVKHDQSPDALFGVLVPLQAPGVTIVPDWDAMGMRGSGSNSVELNDVFVPEDCVIAHPHQQSASLTKTTKSGQAARTPGLQIALPVITAVYLGIARRTHRNAIRRVVGTPRGSEPQTVRLAGLMSQELHSAWWALNAAIRAGNDNAIGTEAHFVTTMLAKRQAILGALAVAQLAMEMIGGSSYFRTLQFEQALRDIRAALTHPLSPEASLFEVGQSVLDRAFDGPAD